jgi:apolipoprotein N-acyltransferase
MKNLRKKTFDFNKIFITKLALAFCSGVGSAFAFAPYYVFSLFIVSFCFLIYLLFRSNSCKESFWIGWVFGFGYFLGGLYWIAYPLIFYFLDQFWWLIPFAIIFIPAILALYCGVCASILHKFNSGKAISFAIYFLCLWVAFEILRNILFTGFPWLIIGYSLSGDLRLMQSASLFGVFGLSVIALSAPVLFFLLFNAVLHNKWNKKRMLVCVVLAGIFAVNTSYGWYRLKNSEIKFSVHEKIKIIQPNINDLLTREMMDKNADKIIHLARLDPIEDRGLLYVLFPEGALSNFNKDKLLQLIKTSIPDRGYLVGGGDRVDYSNRLAWNSAFLINHVGRVINVYDKTHLVPFGEYTPFRKELSLAFNGVVSGFSNNFFEFSKGGGPQTFLPETDFSFTPSICYESLFARDSINKKNLPKLLINFTTDKWYKDSSGPYQHFDMSRLRAVEFGIPLIRVASTGVSCVIDPYGRILTQLPLDKEGIISSYIPLALESKSFYTSHGDAPAILFLCIIFLATYLISFKKYN